jgi:hypothetical protein
MSSIGAAGACLKYSSGQQCMLESGAGGYANRNMPQNVLYLTVLPVVRMGREFGLTEHPLYLAGRPRPA